MNRCRIEFVWNLMVQWRFFSLLEWMTAPSIVRYVERKLGDLSQSSLIWSGQKENDVSYKLHISWRGGHLQILFGSDVLCWTFDMNMSRMKLRTWASWSRFRRRQLKTTCRFICQVFFCSSIFFSIKVLSISGFQSADFQMIQFLIPWFNNDAEEWRKRREIIINFRAKTFFIHFDLL